MIGWLGAVLLAFCALPQSIKSARDGHSNGISVWSMMMWLFGEVFTLSAVIRDLGTPYLLFNYTANILFLSVIVYYKFFPRYGVYKPVEPGQPRYTYAFNSYADANGHLVCGEVYPLKSGDQQ